MDNLPPSACGAHEPPSDVAAGFTETAGRDPGVGQAAGFLSAMEAARIAGWEWVVGSDQVYWTRGTAGLFGLAEGEFDGTLATALALIHPEDRARVQQQLTDAGQHGGDFTTEFRTVWPNGELHVIAGRGRLIETAEGVKRIVGMGFDVTGLKHAEQAWRQAEQRERARADELAAVMEAVPAAIFITHDPDGRHITGNQLARQMLRLEPGKNLSLSAQRPEDCHCRLFQNDRPIPPDQLPVQRASRGESVDHWEGRVDHDDGQQLYIHGNARPLKTHDGQIRGAVGAFLDITDRVRTDQALREKEQRFRYLSNTLPVFIWIADPAINATYLNEWWYHYTGLSEGQSLGQGWQQVVHPDDLERIMEQWAKVQATPGLFETELRCRRHDGAYRWFLVRANPVCDAQGRVVEWFGSSTDVHERKLAEQHLASLNEILEQRVTERTEALAQSERLFRTVGEQIPYGTWVADRDGSIRYFSQSFLDLLGMSLDQARGFGWMQRLPVDAIDPTLSKWRQTVETDDRWEHEHQIFDGQGQAHNILSRGCPVDDQQGQANIWAGINLDITGWRQTEALVHEREEELAHVGRLGLISEMASGLGHELNQPLTAISTCAELCLNAIHQQNPNGSAAGLGLEKPLRQIVNQTQRAGQIIRSLREFVRKGEMDRQPLCLNELIQEVTELTRADLQAAGVELIFDFHNPSPCAAVSRTEIGQVVLNLIRNAMEALKESDDTHRRICVQTTEPEPGCVQVTVQDNGPPLSEQAFSRIFDPFYSTKESGMGMGLNLCETIVHHHEGKLWAERNPQRGLSIHMRFPTIHPAHNPVGPSRD
jgi:PAS domain S-box-containing protein